MHAYLLALEIEPVEENRVYVALPLHCTVMPWFFTEHNPADVLRVIKPVLEAQVPIMLTGGIEAFFGDDGDVPVNVIVDAGDLSSLHTGLLKAIEQLGVEFNNSQWIGTGFTPHVTRQRSGRFEEGKRALVRKLYLAEALVPEELTQKNIVARVSLSGS